MATNRTFDAMLNEYLTYDLLKSEFIKRSWLMENVEIDDGWKGGTLPVPFKGAQATSLSFGGLTSESDVAEYKYVRGEVTNYTEVWGTLLFNHKDLMEHDGKVSEKSFLKILPDQIDEFMDWMKSATSIQMLRGPHFDKAAANGTVGAGIQVERPDLFEIGMKVIVDDNDSAPVTGYVRTIDINTGVVVLYDARTGGAVVDLSGYTTAQSAVFYFDGAQSNSFTSLKSSLLSAANGGSATLYGQTKTAYPHLQSVQIDGSTVTATNILEKLYDGFIRHSILGKGRADKLVMDYNNFGSIMKILEDQKGPFNIVPNSRKSSVYGYDQVMISGPRGTLTLVAVQEMTKDFIMYMDMKALKFHSNGMFQKRTAPDGKIYYEIRSTTGYKYILDISLFGELILNKPAHCAIMHSISY